MKITGQSLKGGKFNLKPVKRDNIAKAINIRAHIQYITIKTWLVKSPKTVKTKTNIAIKINENPSTIHSIVIIFWQTNSEWEGVGFNIYLGMDLMREMLTNYKDSLIRKRKCFNL